jgi:hypothetical protein
MRPQIGYGSGSVRKQLSGALASRTSSRLSPRSTQVTTVVPCRIIVVTNGLLVDAAAGVLGMDSTFRLPRRVYAVHREL